MDKTTLGQSEPGCNGNEVAPLIPQSCRTGDSLPEAI